MKNLTPAMRQYLEIKEQYKDCIIFFRMGDFYEMFFDDAVTASRILDITLTSRNKNKENSIPLCGVPYHAASSYIARLIEEGYKVAVCEQVEDPRTAKGIVRREVLRVITPGLVVDAENLEAKENNYCAAVSRVRNMFGLAVVDISTGEFRITEEEDVEILGSECVGLGPKEVLISEELREDSLMELVSRRSGRCLVNHLSPEYFSAVEAQALFNEWFSEEQLSAIEPEKHPAALAAGNAVLRYVKETQPGGAGHIVTVRWYRLSNFLALDETARRNLELFTTIQEGKKEGSLFQVIDGTVTAMGGRRLRRWLNYPLVNVGRIGERLSAVEEIKEAHLQREHLRDLLSRVSDIERLGGRISMGVANGRDLAALGRSLELLPAVREAISKMTSPLSVAIREEIDQMEDVADLIRRSIADDPPHTITDGYLIRKGYSDKLDELVSLSRSGKQWIAALEEKERKRTGINTLKVGFNSVFGYYIEITRANAAMVPPEYVRKQTLVNAERYINEELKEYEATVLNAEERRKQLEYELFVEVRESVGREIRRIQRTASAIADLDALASLAHVAERNNYHRPHVHEGDRIEIADGRHPVVEKLNINGGFVPNDALLDGDENRFLVITGPNMAGKSTYIRQIALIVLLAQMGSFVPARSADIGIVDRIFTRVGAADSLARGLSTFMVEMTEVAGILKNATPRSLVLLDEVGRGTSTFDGLSIAWAVTEYIHDSPQLGARTLFATHYHELIDIARTRKGVKNYSIAVKEWGEDIVFLRKIISGGTNRSYGIQVARLAGVPGDVIARAGEILKNLERGELDESGMPRIARGGKQKEREGQIVLPLFMDREERILQDIRKLDIGNLTPLEALQVINEWQLRLKKDD